MTVSLTQWFGRQPERKQRRIVRLASLLLVVTCWEVLGRALGSVILAPVSTVVPTYFELMLSGPMLPALTVTVREMLVGFALAALTAIPVGVIMGRSVFAHSFANPLVSGLLVTSTSSLLPLLLVLFGIGFSLRIVVVWIASVAHITISVYHGMKNIDQAYLDVGRSFDASTYAMFRDVYLPAMAPYLTTGLRLGVNRSIQGIILIQMYILVGYGGLIYRYGSQSVTTDAVLALTLTIMFLAYGVNAILEKVTTKLAPWARDDGGV